jgi:1,4-alpha-glucan branching enzyme
LANKIIAHSLFSDFDINLYQAGKHFRLFDRFGSHLLSLEGEKGCYFAVYAPSARLVEVVGDFNFWNGKDHQLHVRWDGSGIWEGFIPDIKKGTQYKYRIYSHNDTRVRDKADPFARLYEMPPRTASVVWEDEYKWKDSKWLKQRKEFDAYNSPVTIYEMHYGSWRKKKGSSHSFLYNEIVEELVDYLTDMNYTHVEFLPLTEHPYYMSWGYQSTGFFAPTSRFGNAGDLKYLIDKLHEAGIGVIMDWVPAHFPSDDHALADFDGSCVYEHPDPKKGFHPDWNSLIFNFERNEIRSFLISSAHFWFDHFHIDGIRVDAVASMLYLDYSRKEGEWESNKYGGNENLEVISFLKELNQSVYSNFPGILMMAEESTSFAGVSKPVDQGGLGFGFKWMMGWMNDTLKYFARDPIYRQFHQNEITFSMVYAYSENYILPLSHDEIVHGKQSMIYKMPGDEWQKFGNLRLLFTYMYTHPGHKLLFMGNDIGQTTEWNVNGTVEWDLLKYAPHQGIQSLVRDLNNLLHEEPALCEKNFAHDGFEWIDFGDNKNSVIVYARKGTKSLLVVACNFTPNALKKYSIGLPEKGTYKEIFNSDDKKYWGSGQINSTQIKSKKKKWHNKENSMEVNLPPLGVAIFKPK